MPTLNLGQVRPVYRGAWNSIDTYSAYDFVIYNGSAYLALKDVPANYEPPSQTEYWVLFGAKGEPGAPGADGEDGAQGERGPSPAYRWDGTFLSIQNPDGTWPDQGIDLQGPPVPLSNSVTSTSETDAASSKAVKTAYDLATTARNEAASKVTDAQAAHAAMPLSGNRISVSAGIGETFTAPADGWIEYLLSTASQGAFARFDITGRTAIFTPFSSGAGQYMYLLIPISQGEAINFSTFSGVVSGGITCNFIYANGAV